MSRATIIGVRRLDYTNKTGKHVQGYSLHYGEADDRFVGLSCANTYLNDERFAPLLSAVQGDLKKLINRPCDLVYNKYGIESVKLLAQ